jgi:hypothetical protein
MSDDLEKRLRSLKADVPEGRSNLNETEKDALVKAIGGPRTARSIRKAMKDYPRERIPFLFSSLDTQLVVDVLANDMDAAIERALKKV